MLASGCSAHRVVVRRDVDRFLEWFISTVLVLLVSAWVHHCSELHTPLDMFFCAFFWSVVLLWRF